MSVFNQTPARRTARIASCIAVNVVLLGILSVALLGARAAQAGAILVGRGPSCTKHTVQDAITLANSNHGYSLILVTDDVPGGAWHENLSLDLHRDVQIELVGGFDNCRDLAPTALGKASLYGGTTLVKIRGNIDLRMRGFWLEGASSDAINSDADGRIELRDVTINRNGRDGILAVAGAGNALRLDILGNVQVQSNGRYGIAGSYGLHVTMRGDDNRVRDNAENGIEIYGGNASVDIGATGPVVSGNGGYGVNISYYATNSLEGESRLFSTNPAKPLGIDGNRAGAIRLRTLNAYRICARNISVNENSGRIVHAEGGDAAIELNGADCEFPPEAGPMCGLPLGPHTCNSIAWNTAAGPLVSATDGARIELDRVLINQNSATSILSTNLGTANSGSSITLADALVIGNTLRDNLFESLNRGIVDIWNSTILGNGGPFGVSLVGINPALFQITESILDQPQVLLANEGLASAIHLDRVLARNDIGADGVPREMIIGQPIYSEGLGRLSRESPGVDYARAAGGTDIEGHPRDVDTVEVANTHGPRDLGAFEYPIAERSIFADGFE